MAIDLTEAREAAKGAKAKAKEKMEAARREARDAKALRANPVPQYVSIPKPKGDAEEDSKADLTALQEGFRRRANDEGKRFARATDSEYWACLCFQTREQKEAFLNALGILGLGDKYIDGRDAAEKLGIELPSDAPPYHDTTRIDKTWSGFVD